jgi:hypothetical protein
VSKKITVKKNQKNEYEMRAVIVLKLDYWKDKKGIVKQGLEEIGKLAAELGIDIKDIWCQFEGDDWGLTMTCKGPFNCEHKIAEIKNIIPENFPAHNCVW